MSATMAAPAVSGTLARVAPPASYRTTPTPKTSAERVADKVAAWDKQSQDAAKDTYKQYELLAYNPANGLVYLRDTGIAADRTIRQVNTLTDSCTCPAHTGHISRLLKECRACGIEAPITCKHRYIVTRHEMAGVVLADLPTPAGAARVIGQEVA